MVDVRVRFAPSPTGYVHVGSLRTALYNYLFARHNKGQFVLRIEDTDRNRYVPGAVENLLETLQWAGLDYDEGPEKGGPYGPYFQSERMEIYSQHVQILLEKDAAYPCFCSEERLSAMREEQAQKNLPIMYDGHCRNIPKEQALERMKNETHVIRLKVPRNGTTIVEDLIRGTVSFENNVIDDQILLKSDGYPTYHLANVVDDHLMKISHVIRGEEWLPSTPKHILLYQAFGWELPQFAHLPLLLNPDRTKLSKRQGDVAVEDYRAKGFLPQALVNFVALLGWNKGDDQEIFSLEELIEYFSLERVNKAGAVFDLKKLEWMNGHYIRNIDEQEYLKIGGEWLKKLGLD
ncbi:MAG TPA: glutamate--tRNA ligase, partial [Caldithrix abyssi]|nr:glutamate--tRNA ligase [Caldithrix abyssi]